MDISFGEDDVLAPLDPKDIFDLTSLGAMECSTIDKKWAKEYPLH